MFNDSYICSVPFFLHEHNSALELALVFGPAAAFVVLIAFTIIIAVIVIVLARRYRGQFAVVSTEAHTALTYHTTCWMELCACGLVSLPSLAYQLFLEAYIVQYPLHAVSGELD